MKHAWLFTGQGAQYPGMGKHALAHQPEFKKQLSACAEILKPHLGLDLVELMQETWHDPHPMHQTRLTQPSLFAFEYAMAKTLQEHGLQPDLLIGHSVGEIAAATFAGMMSLQDGLYLIAERARLMQELPQGGGMAALMCDREQANNLCQQLATPLDLAGINGPKQTVVSGPLAGIEAIVALAKAQKIRAVALTVSHAFHSHLMDPMLDAFHQVASSILYQEAKIPVISNVSGQVLAGVDADYWCQHVRSAVNFSDGIATCADLGARHFVEVGPQPVLCGLGSRSLKAHEQVSLMEWLGCAHIDPEKDREALASVLANA